ncbi:MAG TPA: Fic family protein, partial [Planctomycetota bacterium]|nr:Fic family protein [Planctomycetota bacterium]
VLRKIRPEEAGRYRRHELRMSANPLKPPAPQKISALMSALHATLKDVQREFDRAYPADPSAVLRAAVETYHRIGVIHPFQDGNGRVARLAMNHLLRRYQLGYVIYPPLSHCPPLWQALLQAGNGVLDPLMDIARACWHKV